MSETSKTVFCEKFTIRLRTMMKAYQREIRSIVNKWNDDGIATTMQIETLEEIIIDLKKFDKLYNKSSLLEFYAEVKYTETDGEE